MNHIVFFTIAMLAYFQPMVRAQRSGTTRGNVFVGCSTYVPSIGGDTVYPASATTQYNNGLACSNACSARPDGSFSYFSQADRTCRCSQYYPTYATYYSSGNQGGCSAADGANEVYRLRTTFTQYQSYPCRPLASIDLTYSNVNGNINSCFQQCRSFSHAVYVPRGNGVNGFQCACTNSPASAGLNSNSPFTCALDTPRIYVHSAAAQASQLNRRRRLASQHNEVPELCPKGSVACRVAGFSDSYECLDTNSELESCGGCMHGQFDGHNGTAGVDCNSLGGRLGSYSCLEGMCVSAL